MVTTTALEEELLALVAPFPTPNCRCSPSPSWA